MSDDLPYDPNDTVLGEGDTVDTGRLDTAGQLGDQPFELHIEPAWPGPVWWRIVHRGDTDVYLDYRSNVAGVENSVGLSVTADTEPGKIAEWAAFTEQGQITVSLAYAPS